MDSNAQTRLLNAERHVKRHGVVKVAIDALVFPPDDTSFDINVHSKKVARLNRIFKIEGCDRLDPRHYIPGIITSDVLQAAMTKSNLTTTDLYNTEDPRMMYLPPCATIRCAHGRSRIKALDGLRRLGRWWTIELYVDLVPEAFKVLSEEFLNEGSFSDGHICAQICSNPLSTFDNRWWARLSKSKADILKRVLKHHSLAPALKRVILQIPGIRDGMEIGVWHKIVGAKNFEEIIHYLNYIYQTWVYIMGSEVALHFIDNPAVNQFQLRAPGSSHQDYTYIENCIMNGDVLKNLTDDTERRRILLRMQEIPYLIPSMHTLQKDFKYLRPCTDTLRQLILGKSRLPCSTQTMAFEAFQHGKTSVDPESVFFPKMKLLYLHIMQNLVELSGENPLVEDGEASPAKRLYDQRAWFQLATQANELGFASNEISRVSSIDPDRVVARRALHEARPPSKFDYGSSKMEALISSITQAFQEARPRTESEGHGPPLLTSPGAGEPIPRRCGRQYSSAYAQDRQFLTADTFSRPITKSMNITSLFVRRSVFQAFWGLDNDNQDMARPATVSGLTPPQSVPHPVVDDEAMVDAHHEDNMDLHEEHNSEFDDEFLSDIQEEQSETNDQVMKDPDQQIQLMNRRTIKQSRREKQKNREITKPKERQLVVQAPVLSESVPPIAGEGNNLALIVQHTETDIIASEDLVTVYLLRENAWESIIRCSRRSVVQEIQNILTDNREQELHLFTDEGRGIHLDDCSKLKEVFLCRSSTNEWRFPGGEL